MSSAAGAGAGGPGGDEQRLRAAPGLVELGRGDVELAGDGRLVAAVEHAAPFERAIAGRRDPVERPHDARVRRAERAIELGRRERVEGPLAARVVGVEADDEAAVGALPGGYEVVEDGAAHALQRRVAERAARLEVDGGELGVVVERLLEVGDVPGAVRGVAVEGARQVIADAPAAEPIEGEREVVLHVVHRRRTAGQSLDPAQLGEEEGRVGELAALAEAALDHVAGRAEREHGGAEHVLGELAALAPAIRVGGDLGEQLAAVPGEARGVVAEALIDLAEHVGEAGAASLGDAREVGAAEDGLEVRREDHRERPACRLAQPLHRLDEERVEIGPLLAVDLDGDEAGVEEARGVVVLEGLLLHHVAPVAGGVAHGHEEEAALAARAIEGLGAPRVPVDGVVRVLLEVRARLPDQVVPVAPDDRDGALGRSRRLVGAGAAGDEQRQEQEGRPGRGFGGRPHRDRPGRGFGGLPHRARLGRGFGGLSNETDRPQRDKLSLDRRRAPRADRWRRRACRARRGGSARTPPCGGCGRCRARRPRSG